MLQRAVLYFRHHGAIQTARKIQEVLSEVLNARIYRVQTEVLLEGAPYVVPDELIAAGNDIIVRPFGPKDRSALEECIHTHNVDAEPALERMRSCIASDYFGVVGLLDGKVVAYGWLIAPGQRHPALELYGVTLLPDERFACDLFVAPSCRKHNGGREFLLRAARIFLDMDVKRVITTIRSTNRRSLLVHLQAGFQETGRRRVHVLLNRVLVSKGCIKRRDGLWL